ncbi:MAG: hypothetical protein ACHQQQ_12185 [Bacteroidota bacterium]
MRIFFLAAGIILLFTLPACNGSGTDSGTVSQIDSKITMSMTEVLNPAARTLALTAQTERVYGCTNYAILNTVSVNANTVTLDFTGIAAPTNCVAEVGPADGSLNLGFLPTAIYNFVINVNGVATNATLAVTDSSYQVTNGSSKWTDFTKTFFLKVPPGTIWGNVQYSDPNLLPVDRGFFDSLKALGAQAHVYPAGDYGYFQIDGVGTVVVPTGSHLNYIDTFIFNYGFDMLKVRALVKSLALRITINLYGSNGEVYLTSVLAHEP